MYTSAQISSIDASVGVFSVGKNWTVIILLDDKKLY